MVYQAIKDRLDIKNKTVLVIGSETPWIEVICLKHGAKQVTTVDYVTIDSEHPNINTVLHRELNEQYLRMDFEPFDIVISFSSLEHSGKNFDFHRGSQYIVFNSGQKMELRAFYFTMTLTLTLTYYYMTRSQRHVLTAIENNRLDGLIDRACIPYCWLARYRNHFFSVSSSLKINMQCTVRP